MGGSVFHRFDEGGGGHVCKTTWNNIHASRQNRLKARNPWGTIFPSFGGPPGPRRTPYVLKKHLVCISSCTPKVCPRRDNQTSRGPPISRRGACPRDVCLSQITSDDPKRQTVSLVLADTILICDKPREDGAYVPCHAIIANAPQTLFSKVFFMFKLLFFWISIFILIATQPTRGGLTKAQLSVKALDVCHNC